VLVQLQRATLNFVMSVRMEQLGSNWTDFCDIWYLSIFRNSVKKSQALLKSDKNNGYFRWRPAYIYDNISLSSSCNANVFDENCRENQNTYFTLNNCFPKIVPFMLKSMVQPDRPQVTLRLMLVACWKTKAIQRHTQNV
jgi:hypothetical protein